MEIRTKDKLFLLVAIPLAAAALYVCRYRTDAVKRIDDCGRRLAALVEPEDFPFEKKRAQSALAEAEAALGRERAVPVPAARVKGTADETAAARELAVITVFREAGLAVRRSEIDAGRSSDVSATGAAVLKATGVRPTPVARRYLLEGPYPALQKALKIFADREMAVVVTAIGMREGGAGRWTLEAVL